MRSVGGPTYFDAPRSFMDDALELRPINVVIGANGSGKTNFLEVFAFLRSVRAGRLRRYVQRASGAEKILHFGRRRTSRMAIEVWFRHEGGSRFSGYQIGLEPTDSDGLVPAGEVVLYWEPENYPKPFDTGPGPVAPPLGEAAISMPAEPDENPVQGTAYYSLRARELAREHLGSWRRFQFHDTSAASPIKRACDVHDNRYLRADGANLAAYLYRLRHTHSESYSMICKTIHLVAPFFEDFQLEPLALNTDKMQLDWHHRGSDDYFGPSSLSDGTLRFMALATLLMQPVELRPKVILIDEPELGLHPYAIGILASMIRSASKDTQVIVATQSPILLDYFEPEEVLVAERKDEETKLRRLETEPLREWLEDYSLGQLWEKNELGGRPGSE
ncbi:MAG: AAA family ATPase [Acidobacteria bacterium]|nr:AAA family ATPase [Acidobacteriota bacterium]